MKWRLIDCIDGFEKGSSICGRKTVSLEEYSLLEVLGRKGSFPESLMLESCVHLTRWLTAVSSDFEQSCILYEVGRFAFEHETKPGAVLKVKAKVLEKQPDMIRVQCEVTIEGRRCGHGELALSLIPLQETGVVEDARTLWQELYAKA